MGEFDIGGMIDRAKGPKKAKSVLDILTGQPGSGGTYDIFKGRKNDPVTPGGPYQEAPPIPAGPSPEQVATSGDMGQAEDMRKQEAMARWQAAPAKMKAMFHNNFEEYLQNVVTTGRDVLKEFSGGMQSGGTGPILD